MYDAAGRCVQLAENGSTPSYSGNVIKNFLCAERCEERDSSNAVVSTFSGMGQKTSGTNEFYSFDHLGSIREVTNGSGTVQGAFDFDPYGNMSVLSGSVKPDFGYTGIYQHSRTNLALTWFRQYNPGFGRWLSRDPVGESAGLNLYGYTGNNTISFVDPLGLDAGYPWMFDPKSSHWPQPEPGRAARPVDWNRSGKPTRTNAPQSVRSISTEGYPGSLHEPNNTIFKGPELFIPNDVTPNAGQPLTEVSACHSSEPAPGYTNQNTSSAAMVAKYAGTYTLGYEGTVCPSTGASYNTFWFNLGIKVPTPATVFNRQGQPVYNLPTPVSRQDFVRAQDYARSH